MDSPTPAAQPSPSPVPRRRRFRLRLALVFAGSLLLAVCVLLVWPDSASRKVDWLTPAQLAEAAKPGPFLRAKQDLKVLAAPLWRWYRSRRAKIQVSSNLMQLSPAAAQQAGLGAPTATNADGMRAWVLSPADFETFRQRLKMPATGSVLTNLDFNSGVYLLPSPTILTGDSQPAHLGMGGPVPLAPGHYGAVAVNLDVHAGHMAGAGAVRLQVVANSQELVATNPATSATIRTNFFACRVAIPDAGALIVQYGNWGETRETNYWLILSPQPVHPQKP